jgi:hypothetical protein
VDAGAQDVTARTVSRQRLQKKTRLLIIVSPCLCPQTSRGCRALLIKANNPMRKRGFTVFNGKTISKHKVHEGHEGKMPET